MRLLKLSKRGFSTLVLHLFAVAVCFSPGLMRGDEIRFGEAYSEKVVEGEVVKTNHATLNITLPHGINIADLDGSTEIIISIGGFEFNDLLDGADEYEEGVSTSVTYTDFDGVGGRLNVSWNTKTFTISGLIRHSSEGAPGEMFFGADNYFGQNGTITPTQYSADIQFGDLVTNKTVNVTGRNTVTYQAVEDEDPIPLNNIQLSGSAILPAPDTTRPTVSIISPLANGRLFTPYFTGKASDNRVPGVAEVFYRIGTDEFTLANGTTNWSADVSLSLQPGTNTMQVKSVDSAGNESLVLTRTFFYVVTNSLTVGIDQEGWGSTTLTNGQFLELTKNYSITAKPATNYLFREWLGVDTTNPANPTLKFTMTPDLELQAVFTPNQFIPIKGIFNGLFSDTNNGVAPASAGFLTITLKDSGAYTGKILLGGATHPISGLFGWSGHASKTILRYGKPSLQLEMQFDFEARLLNGSIAQSNVTSDLKAELAQSATNSTKTKYTLLIPPSVDPATAPGGYGYGSATVDLKGKLQFRGALGDGTVVSQGLMVSENGRWPWFASLYRGKGVFLGWMSFTNEPDSDVRGTNITWAKLSGVPGRFYTNVAFTLEGEVVGSKYVAPLLGSPPLLDWTAGSVEFSGGNLVAPLTNSVTYTTNNKILIDPTNKTLLTIVPASGLLNGRFVNPSNGKTIPVKGALLQKQQMGAGFFLGTNQTGSFLLQPDL